MNRILSFTLKGIKNYKNNTFSIDFINKQNVQENYGELHRISNSVYDYTAVSLIGQNASGKTTAINLISWAINFFLRGKSRLENLERICSLNKEVSIELISLIENIDNGNSVMKLEAKLTKNNDGILIFKDEKISVRKLRKFETKISVKEFNEVSFDRNFIIELLSSKISNKDELVKNQSNFTISSVESITRFFSFGNAPKVKETGVKNQYSPLRMRSIFDVPIEILKYLDSSIESLESIEIGDESKESSYELTFTSGQVIKGSLLHISRFLSSGTLRGAEIMKNAFDILETGGYLIVDEIELSLHKTLVLDLIRLYTTSKTNPHSSVLIFSTHYSEVLDSFSRLDNIFLCTKTLDNQLNLINFSELCDRNSNKKSDIYLKNLTEERTTPTYEGYIGVMEYLNKRLEKNKPNGNR